MTLAVNAKTSFQNYNISSFTTGSITPSVGGCIIVAIVQTLRVSQAAYSNITGTPTGGGLTWQKRTLKQYNGGTNLFSTEIWWAYQATAAAVSFSATLSNTAEWGCNVTLFAVSGVQNTVNPWDSNGALPATNTYNSGTTTRVPATGNPAFSSASAMIIATDINNNGSNSSGTPGFSTGTVIETFNGSSGQNANSVTGYNLQSGPGNSAIAFSGNVDFSDLVVVDALSGDAAAGGHPTSAATIIG